ncbi:hypothetical protein [Methanonatronarchaeum sp. AMET-Sl]|uniref:hypothetical protein n=1 Tax=Methanonatronarchaeum sp. AMET-Sl TaxID=3037654 RepID=UPI00244DAF58|nr:hypothetical protein [Methanonatronarchaeum sp. AMET-Sl]WGI17758.1 hypothetical protein QEN48_01765 [Methanonatronarchaeum sp. AMET-Sl]
MDWYLEKFNEFKKQSNRILFITIFAKFLFGVGLGALLASYFQAHDWILWGWILIIVSLLLSIPVIYALFIQK